MKRLKPDFSMGSGGLVDPEFIPESVRRELLLHLNNAPLSHDQKESLLEYANDIAQMVLDGELESGKTQREQIEAVAANARRLLQSLNMLGQSARDAISGHTDYLAYGSAPPVELDDQIKDAIKRPGSNLLSASWDWIDALETASTYTTEQFKIDKTSKPEQMQARGYVAMMAERVRELTGSKPPYDRAAWFSSFSECLGRHLGLKIGPRIVESGIKAIR
jgi:hypothetical protein